MVLAEAVEGSNQASTDDDADEQAQDSAPPDLDPSRSVLLLLMKWTGEGIGCELLPRCLPDVPASSAWQHLYLVPRSA